MTKRYPIYLIQVETSSGDIYEATETKLATAKTTAATMRAELTEKNVGIDTIYIWGCNADYERVTEDPICYA